MPRPQTPPAVVGFDVSPPPAVRLSVGAEDSPAPPWGVGSGSMASPAVFGSWEVGTPSPAPSVSLARPVPRQGPDLPRARSPRPRAPRRDPCTDAIRPQRTQRPPGATLSPDSPDSPASVPRTVIVSPCGPVIPETPSAPLTPSTPAPGAPGPYRPPRSRPVPMPAPRPRRSRCSVLPGDVLPVLDLATLLAEY